MKLKYIGESFYSGEGLTNGNVYDCLGIEGQMLRVIDDSGEDYLYDSVNPGPLDGSSEGGCWEVIEDDAEGTFKTLIDALKRAVLKRGIERSWLQ